MTPDMATLNTDQLAGAPYQIPPEPSRLPSMLMAMLVHGVLIGFLWFGINWQNTEPTAVEAEVWDMETMQAAPPPQAQPEPEPEPLPRPEPTPAPAPTPAPKVIEPPAPPKVVEPPAVKKAPDIALEREKEQKKKLLEKKLAEEKLLAEKKKELAELKKKELAEKEKQLDDKKARDLAAKKEKDKADKLAKAAKAAQELAETKRLDKLRDAEMARIANAAGSTGSAAKSTSPNLDNSYKAAINAKIKGNTSFGGSGAIIGNPYVSFTIQQLPTGEIISVRKVKSSGVDAFDDAVERGINNSSPLPKRKDGTVERTLTVGYRLNDID